MLLAERRSSPGPSSCSTRRSNCSLSNAGLRLNLAKIYIKAGDKARAKAELETLAKLGEKFPAQPEVAALLKSL